MTSARGTEIVAARPPFGLNAKAEAKLVDMTQTNITARSLADAGLLPIRWGSRLEQGPAVLIDIDVVDRMHGMLLGLAIGDALGNTSESLLPSERHARYGRITDYRPNRYAGNRPFGLPSDDTQLAFWTLEHLIEAGRLDPAGLAAAFSQRRIFGLGQSVREFLRNYKGGVDWTRAGAESAGNGALMRIAPVLVPYLDSPSAALYSDALLAAHITHRDALSNAACVAFVDLLWQLIGMTEPPESRWWLDHFAAFCAEVEPDTRYVPRGGRPEGFEGTLSTLVRDHVAPALRAALPVEDACALWHSGAYLLETVPCVLYILARHGHDPEAAIIAAVNDTKDNDTIAAIVGAAVGALHGRRRLPQRWIAGLLGRTTEDDDGRVFELISMATDSLLRKGFLDSTGRS